MSGTEPRPGGDPLDRLGRAVLDSGLVSPGESAVVLVSGGPDSACLAAGISRALGPEGSVALHVNYGLRPEADSDQAVAERLCRGLGLELVTIRAGPPAGNVQDWAREFRYREAGSLRRRRECDWIAVGHSRTDRVETAVYRLAASPGTRALLGMKARRDRLVRPLLGLDRDTLRQTALAAGLPFADDRSNLDPAFARTRVREWVMPKLRTINSGAERNIDRTLAELEQDEDLLGALAAESVTGRELAAGQLERLHPALRRRALRLLAERALERPVAVTPQTAAAVLRLALHPEGGRIDAGGGAFFVAKAGRISIEPRSG